jgi:hypothetical protein
MLGELLGELILKPLMEAACYVTGKPVVWLLTRGRYRIELEEPDARGKRERRWYSLTFTRRGRRYVEPHVVTLVGLLVWVALIAAGVCVFRRV